MPDVETNLLESIPTGEIIKDPREGDHLNATLIHAEIVEQGNGPALKLTYGGLVDTTGRDFQHQERYTIPTSNSEDFIHRMFLAVCHDLGVVPRTKKVRILVDSEGDQQEVLKAFESIAGTPVPLKLTQDNKTGYMRARIIRAKKS